MAPIDWAEERKRLRDLYGDMEDGELEKIAREADGLTEVASEEIKSEMARRGIKLPPRRSKTVHEGAPPVMVGRYRDLPDAQIAKSILDSAGIESFLADENLVRLDWFYSNLIGGIKLLVRDEDAETARKLLSRASWRKARRSDWVVEERPLLIGGSCLDGAQRCCAPTTESRRAWEGKSLRSAKSAQTLRGLRVNLSYRS